jgi:hypothetical protein
MGAHAQRSEKDLAGGEGQSDGTYLKWDGFFEGTKCLSRVCLTGARDWKNQGAEIKPVF